MTNTPKYKTTIENTVYIYIYRYILSHHIIPTYMLSAASRRWCNVIVVFRLMLLQQVPSPSSTSFFDDGRRPVSHINTYILLPRVRSAATFANDINRSVFSLQSITSRQYTYIMYNMFRAFEWRNRRTHVTDAVYGFITKYYNIIIIIYIRINFRKQTHEERRGSWRVASVRTRFSYQIPRRRPLVCSAHQCRCPPSRAYLPRQQHQQQQQQRSISMRIIHLYDVCCHQNVRDKLNTRIRLGRSLCRSTHTVVVDLRLCGPEPAVAAVARTLSFSLRPVRRACARNDPVAAAGENVDLRPIDRFSTVRRGNFRLTNVVQHA